eukprot:scaffold26091_cov62-Phaeocystis_antarctica.AAC.3
MAAATVLAVGRCCCLRPTVRGQGRLAHGPWLWLWPLTCPCWLLRAVRPPRQAAPPLRLAHAPLLRGVRRRAGPIVALESGISPGAAEPLNNLEVAIEAGGVQWCLSIAVNGVERGTQAVQPLGDVEVTAGAGLVQRRLPTAVGGVDRGARTVQPLSDVEMTSIAGVVKWCISIAVGGAERDTHAA